MFRRINSRARVINLWQPFRSNRRIALLLNYAFALLQALFVRCDADCLVAITGQVTDVAAVAWRRRRKALKVLYLDNLTVRGAPGSMWWLTVSDLCGRYAESLYRRFDCVFAASSPVAEDARNTGVPDENVYTTTCGLEEGVLLQALGNRPPRVAGRGIFVGRLNDAKGIFDLLLAWPEILQQVPYASLLVLGDGDAETVQRFRKSLRATPGSDRIATMGYVAGAHKYELLLSSSALLFPSYSESYGIAIAEALACGIPVVAYDIRGVTSNWGAVAHTVRVGDIHAFATMAASALRGDLPRPVVDLPVSYDEFISTEIAVIRSRLGSLRMCGARGSP